MTTNQPESLEIPGSNRRISLHIVAESGQKRENGEVRIPIKAQFLVDGRTNPGLSFLDETVRVPHFQDCDFKMEDDKVGNIAMGKYQKYLKLDWSHQ